MTGLTSPTGLTSTPPVTVDVEGWGWRHQGRRAWALRGVDLRVEPGERVLLLGPSGSGKSTLLAALAGLLDPAEAAEHQGAVHLDGVPSRAARARAALVLQDPEAALVMGRAGDDVAFGLENRAVPAEQIWARVDEALAAVGFGYGRDARTETLSGGEQQRLAIAGMLALRPGLLLLDEITANLDPDGAALVRRVLADVLDSTGATALIVEHRVDDVVDLVDRAVVLEAGGGVVADGPPADVFGRYGEALAARGVWVPGRQPVVHRAATAAAAASAATASAAAAAVPGPALMTADAAGFRYPTAARDALSPTDAALRAGEALAVTGPNGSGKSTLALLLAGLLRPTTGRVVAERGLSGLSRLSRLSPRAGQLPPWRWRGRDLARAVGTVFQDPEHQFVTGSVRAELELGPRRTGAEPGAARRRADMLMERLGLAGLAEANPFTLSGGEKRRLSVATAIATAPPVVVTDEPTFGQDSRTWAELADLLADLRDEGTALALVTHDRALVDAIADRELSLGSFTVTDQGAG